MKKLTLSLLTISLMLCGFAKLPPDDSILKATALIKKYVSSTEKVAINIRIINSHNGRYTIVSSLQTTKDSVRLSSHIVDMMGGERDTTIQLSRKIFLIKLNEASIPPNLIFAGHRQTITVKKAGREDVFQTTGGRALMDLLEYGN